MDTNSITISKVILQGIRKTLIELGSATKAELSESLGVSFPTISKFLREMEKDGEISLVGLDESSGGRRAKRYTYNSDYMLGLAIYLEKTETNYTVFNCLGGMKETGKTSSLLVNTDLNQLTDCIERIVEKHPKIGSIAIGVPGSVDNGRIFYIPGYEHLQHLDLKGLLEERFLLPVLLENDMNAAVLGYRDRMRIQDKEALVYLYSGQNGPGAGILINGDVVRGSTFFSGEVSFVPQYDNLNFGKALEKGKISRDMEIDAISRLVASFVAIINPDTIIFNDKEVDDEILNNIHMKSSVYVPSEHLPKLMLSNWKYDYLFGLQRLGLDLLLQGTNGEE
ncbi:ROK family transcriptional regulator [Ornithinibacillus scapharcae]|uniref:ROK family transcriptional regulator n=1 Tax=Ornithinibacillus scapharcae TaxID=1147159 RepID=UPI000225BD12|nr:ROK family protein [Ornithinibacillus scapharcae]